MPAKSRPHSQRIGAQFPTDWWNEFGTPVVGKGYQPNDLHWIKVGLTILHIGSETAIGMFLALIFDEDRNRARRGLDSLRSEYKQTHPALAKHWGRGRSGRPDSIFSEMECADIALAHKDGIEKWKILQELGLAGKNSMSSTDTHLFKLINRAIKRGYKLPRYLKGIAALETKQPEQRKQILLTRLQKAKKTQHYLPE